ncbi:5093_t:CDS:2, partial [Cetraspora pellucida]
MCENTNTNANLNCQCLNISGINDIICDSDNNEDKNAHIVEVKKFFQHIIDSIKQNRQLLASIKNFKKEYEKAKSLSS